METLESPLRSAPLTAPRLCLADADDREQIYRIRHDVYARELGQHHVNSDGRLSDRLDAFNEYIVAKQSGCVLGFISVTPPTEGGYSIDKYLSRAELPFACDDRLYEVRLLTVVPEVRRGRLAAALMYAALRFIEARGGSRIVGIGRQEVLDVYRRAGLKLLGRELASGAVKFELMSATTDELRQHLVTEASALRRLLKSCEWDLPFAATPPAVCFHGGVSIREIGQDFRRLDRRDQIVNADVLDAWFPPSPRVIEALTAALPWLAATSPPAACDGLIEAIARSRGVPAESIIVGAGSSDLIFRALRHWLTESSSVLLPDPTYGEYQHVFSGVIRCDLHRLPLLRADGYALHMSALRDEIERRHHDMVVLVNPNSPTGRHVASEELEAWLETIPPTTRVWIDEAYIDYVGAKHSLERFAMASENVIVCKTMSKAYALSGLRVGYLCGPPRLMAELRAITPPWIVGLPAQVAAVRALDDEDYYHIQYHRTHVQREQLASALASISGVEVVPGATANFLLVHLREDGPDAAAVVRSCQSRGVYLRDATAMGRTLGRRALRIAVKEEAQNRAIVEAITGALACRRDADRREV